MRATSSVLALVLVAGLAVSARAQPPPEDGTTTSYARYTLLIDGTSLAMLAGGRLVGGDDPTAGPQAVAIIGLIDGMFGVPALHGARGHGERAARSMGMRVGLAGLGMLVQSRVTDCDGFRRCFDPLGPGVLVGMVVASALDALFMTSEHHDAPALKPVAIAVDGGAGFGVARAF